MGSETLTPAQQEQVENRDGKGQFKEKHHDDVEDTTAVLGLNDDLPAGTFRHPPYLATADETIAFFNRVEIDDETIEQFQAAARERSLEQYHEVLREHVEAASAEWVEQNPQPDKSKHFPAWEQSRKEFEDQEVQRLRTEELDSYESAGVAPIVKDSDAQTIIRAYQMARYAPNDPEEKRKLADHRVNLRSTGEDVAVGALHSRHRHPLMREALDKAPEKRSTGDDVQREMLEELKKFNANAEAMHNTQNSIRHNTGTLLDNYNSDRVHDEIARGWRDNNGKPMGPGRSIARRVLGG